MSTPPATTPLHSAWDWSVKKSPIVRTYRAIHHKLHPMHRTDERLHAAELPEPIDSRIRELVRRTRLRSVERDQVCRELIGHAQDALQTTGEGETIADALGDPRAASPLIRRAMKRKRSKLYLSRLWMTRTTLATLATLLLVYAALFIRFHAGSPNIKTDYLARLNAPILATPEEDRAIGVYLEVLEHWRPTLAELRELPKIDYIEADGYIEDVHLIDHIPDIIKPDHPHFGAVRDAFIAYRPQLDRLHEASQRPIMGYVLTTAKQATNLSVEHNPGLADGSLVEVLLPHLGQIRHIARLLAADTRLAVLEGDAQRVTDNLTAMGNTARLLSDDSFLITNMVSIAIQMFAAQELDTVLAEHPDLLTADQLLILSHTLAAARDANLTLDLQTESYMFEDLLQRVFTDDGNGDGRLTPDGLEALMAMASVHNEDFSEVPPSTLSKLAGPLSMEFVASRAEISSVYHGQIQAAQAALEQGPQSLPTLHAKIDELENLSTLAEARVLPIAAVLPAFDKAIQSVFKGRALTDATLVALGAEQYRRKHNEYPQTLPQLVPQYLPALPPDPFDPGQPIKYRLTDTGFMVYLAGADGDDDDGTPYTWDGTSRDKGNPRNVQELYRRFPCKSDEHQTFEGRIPDADWILFPPQSN